MYFVLIMNNFTNVYIFASRLFEHTDYIERTNYFADYVF